MDLTLNNPKRLICQKNPNKQTNKQTSIPNERTRELTLDLIHNLPLLKKDGKSKKAVRLGSLYMRKIKKITYQ